MIAPLRFVSGQTFVYFLFIPKPIVSLHCVPIFSQSVIEMVLNNFSMNVMVHEVIILVNKLLAQNVVIHY